MERSPLQRSDWCRGTGVDAILLLEGLLYLIELWPQPNAILLLISLSDLVRIFNRFHDSYVDIVYKKRCLRTAHGGTVPHLCGVQPCFSTWNTSIEENLIKRKSDASGRLSSRCNQASLGSRSATLHAHSRPGRREATFEIGPLALDSRVPVHARKDALACHGTTVVQAWICKLIVRRKLYLVQTLDVQSSDLDAINATEFGRHAECSSGRLEPSENRASAPVITGDGRLAVSKPLLRQSDANDEQRDTCLELTETR